MYLGHGTCSSHLLHQIHPAEKKYCQFKDRQSFRAAENEAYYLIGSYRTNSSPEIKA
jgi:hypothetical protein